jgi:hypothetical protein
MRFALISVATALLAAAGSSAAAELENGMYACTLGSMTLGDIWIKDGTYVGPSFDEGDPAYSFELTDAGTINWGGPMGGMDSDGNSVVSTVLKDAGGGKAGFDITLQTGTGNFDTSNCSPEF